jgi:hypothetical protein
MTQYVGLDVSLKETKLHVLDEAGNRIWRGRCATDAAAIAAAVRRYAPLVESRCPCRDVGEAILVGSLRPIRTARETLGGRTLERPSCGGFMPTAETTLFPAYSARSRRLLTSSVRLDNEPNCTSPRE